MESIHKSVGQGNERMILVRSVNKNHDKIQCEDVEVRYRREEFHIVDLNLNKIYHNCLPSVPLACGHGLMVASGKSIFSFGALGTFSKESPLYRFVKSNPQLNFHMGASHLHFDPDGSMVRGAWGPSHLMSTLNAFTSTCLNGDVYSVGCLDGDAYSVDVRFYPEVFYVDTTNIEVFRRWKILEYPARLIRCTPSIPVIPDPTANRILFHLHGGRLPSPSLYAFYPPDRQNQDGETGEWQCLNSNFFGWDEVLDAVVLDGVLLLHNRKLPDLLRAYEVNTGKWLDVHWSTRVTEDNIFVNEFTSDFHSLFCLDSTNKILCCTHL